MRLQAHLRDTPAVSEWAARLSSLGREPLVVVLAEFDSQDDADLAERRFIAQFERPRLLNRRLRRMPVLGRTGLSALGLYMSAHKLTQDLLASQLGVKQPHVSKLLGGMRPSLKMAIKLESITGIPVTAWDWDAPLREFVGDREFDA